MSVACRGLPNVELPFEIQPHSPALLVKGASGRLDVRELDDALHNALDDLTLLTHAEALLRVEQMMSGSPLYAHNTADLLVDGPDAYEGMFAAIDAAEHHIHLETYILSDERIGHRLAQRLIAKRRQGVAVRLVYDAVGSRDTDDRFFDDLRQQGIEVHEYNPETAVHALNHRDHRRILEIDGRVAFTGGINLSDAYSTSSFGANAHGGEIDGQWRDTHVAIRGPAVREFHDLFLDTWPREINARLLTPDADGNVLVRVIGSIGGDDAYPIYRTFLSAIAHAHRRIWITQAYFAPDPQFLDAIIRAAQRGVDVRILLPGFSDSSLVLYASQRHFAELLEAGVALYERTDALLHAKTMVIDGYWSTIGSSNLDYRSFLHNNEVNAILIGRRFGERMEKLYELDLRHSQQILPAEWRSRGLWQRMMEQVAGTLEYWF